MFLASSPLIIRNLWHQAATKFGDQIDLLMEQVKILSGEVALISSTLKRYSEDAIDNPRKENIEVSYWLVLRSLTFGYSKCESSSLFPITLYEDWDENLNDEILEKKKQMASLEKSIIASIQAS